MELNELKTQAGVFDKQTLLALYKLLKKKVFSKLEMRVCEGKESVIFRAKNTGFLAVKVHRYDTSDFRMMWKYIFGDPRFKNIKRGRRNIINAWAKKEYSNLKKAYEANVLVPKPYAFLRNVVVMEFIGNEYPAPRLKDEILENPKKTFREIAENVARLYKFGLVHADLSEYNILILEKPYLIDLGSAVLLDHPFSKEFLERDISNLVNYFQKQYGIGTKEEVYELCKK